ncbi:RimK family alpha-L-glutamate ligase [Virgibacillus oceani]
MMNMYTGWLIYAREDAEQNKTFIEWFIKEAHLQNLSLILILQEDLTIGIMDNKPIIHLNGEIAEVPHVAIVRTMNPFLSSHLETCGISVFNSSHVSRICNDKALTHQHVSTLSIPMVDMVFSNKDRIMQQQPFGYPFIVKKNAGRGGKGVYYIEHKKDLLACIDNLDHADFIVQKSNVQLGKDVRAFIVGKEIVGAVLRENNHDFRANFKLGGTAALYHLSDQERKLVEKIIHTFDFGMAGIDFLIGKNGEFLFNEIEDVVGSRTLSAVSDINILKKYVFHITTALKKRNFSS